MNGDSAQAHSYGLSGLGWNLVLRILTTTNHTSSGGLAAPEKPMLDFAGLVPLYTLGALVLLAVAASARKLVKNLHKRQWNRRRSASVS